MFKILEHLKIQQGLRLPCTDCPDGNEAQSRCDDCSIFQCEECHRAHARSRSTRDHKTVTFEEMKGLPVESFRKLHQCKEHQQPQQFFCRTCDLAICVSCTVVDHDKTKDHDVVSVDEAHQDKARATDGVLMKLDKKVETLELKVKHLEEKKTNIQIARQIAIEDVNSTTDSLVELLETRRTSLLTDVDMKTEVQLKVIDQALDSTTTLLAKVKSSTEYTREMRERADKVEDLQLMVSSTDTLNNMLQEKSQDVPFDRTGVTFAPVGVTKMKSLIDVLGSVQTVTFTQAMRPPRAQAGSLYNFISITPADNYQVTGFVQMFEDGTRTFSPHLEYDLNTASADLKFSEGGVSNMRPEAARDTGCRFTSGGQALTLRPLSLRGGELVVFSTKVDLTVKDLNDENVLIWETAVTSSPVDTNRNQPKGLSVCIGKCLCHKQTLCLLVWFYDKLLHDIPLNKYEVGATLNTHLCIVIDKDARKIHLGDVKTAKVVKTLSDVKFERPPWVMLHVDEASKTKITSELVSGEGLIETPGIKQMLSSLE